MLKEDGTVWELGCLSSKYDSFGSFEDKCSGYYESEDYENSYYEPVNVDDPIQVKGLTNVKDISVVVDTLLALMGILLKSKMAKRRKAV